MLVASRDIRVLSEVGGLLRHLTPNPSKLLDDHQDRLYGFKAGHKGSPVDETLDNPSENRLGSGVNEKDLLEAIAKSGHPLQAHVASVVGRTFGRLGSEYGRGHSFVQEEWGYEDPETGDVRAVDALAEVGLWSHSRVGDQPRIRPTLSLLVECKQSELPFVFFTRSARYSIPDYPWVSGFPHKSIRLTTNDDPSSYNLDVLGALGLRFHDFITECPIAVSFSKVRRKGKGELEVAGEDTYRGLTLPLIKAREHLISATRSRGTHFSDGRLVAAVAVLRAPLVAIDEESSSLRAIPWVRVLRYEPFQSMSRHHGLLAYDVVHEGFLQSYLERLGDYAQEFATRVINATGVLLKGRGFAPDLGHSAIPQELLPQSVESRVIRFRLQMESTWQVLSRRLPAYGWYIREPIKLRRRR